MLSESECRALSSLHVLCSSCFHGEVMWGGGESSGFQGDDGGRVGDRSESGVG